MSCVKCDRILPILRIADHAHLQTWFTWFFSSKCVSISKPRSRTTGFGTMTTSSITISWIGSKFLAWQDLRCATSVLSRLQASPLLISMMQSWCLDSMTGRSQRALTVMYNWVSSAYTIQRRPWSRITSSICAKKTQRKQQRSQYRALGNVHRISAYGSMRKSLRF